MQWSEIRVWFVVGFFSETEWLSMSSTCSVLIFRYLILVGILSIALLLWNWNSATLNPEHVFIERIDLDRRSAVFSANVITAKNMPRPGWALIDLQPVWIGKLFSITEQSSLMYIKRICLADVAALKDVNLLRCQRWFHRETLGRIKLILLTWGK